MIRWPFAFLSHRPQGRVLWLVLGCVIALLSLSLGAVWRGVAAPAQAAGSAPTFDGGAKMGSGAPNTTQIYQHTLRNDTLLAQSFSLSVASSKGMTVVVDPTSLTINPAQSATINVSVTLPNGTAPGVLDVATLTAVTTPPTPPLRLEIKDTTLVSTDTALKIPPQQTGRLENGKRIYNLTMAQGTTEFWPGIATKTNGYNGSYLAPTLVMTTGETVLINVTNNLTETTTTHWHGLHLPAKMDGGPHQEIAPGTTWMPSFTIMNEASTMWFHPHPHAMEEKSGHEHEATQATMGASTGTQVYRGLAGLIFIRDAETNVLGLPQRYGIDEFPLVIQDRQFNADGSLKVTPNSLGQRKGDSLLVNGTLAGHLAAPAQMVRFHLLNGSNFRIYNFGFSDNRTFYQIASDDALLSAPVGRTRAIVAPGERIEFVVDLSNAEGQTIHFANFSGELGDTITPNHAADALDRANFVLFTLNVAAPTSDPVTTLPTTLNEIVRMPRSLAKVERRLALTIPPSINGKTFEMDVIDHVAGLDTVELWSVVNLSDVPHPLHIHGTPFQIVARDAPPPIDGEPLPDGGEPPPAYEMGWKDTVLVMPGERVDLIKGVYDYADPTSPFMFHCHLLEHEDDGMMGQYTASRLIFAPMLMR